MVKARQQLKAKDRLSVERIEATLCHDNPEWEKLMELVEGMPVYTDPDFAPNGDVYEPGKMTRRSYTDAEAATNKLTGQWVEDGLALVLPYEAVKHIEDIHISPASWVPKKGSPKGRAITDYSDDTFGSSLNSAGGGGGVGANPAEAE